MAILQGIMDNLDGTLHPPKDIIMPGFEINNNVVRTFQYLLDEDLPYLYRDRELEQRTRTNNHDSLAQKNNPTTPQ